MNFPDWINGQVQLSDLLLLGMGLWTFIKVYFHQQEFNRMVLKLFGSKEPPDGVLGDIEILKAARHRHHDRIVRLQLRQGWIEKAEEPGDDS